MLLCGVFKKLSTHMMKNDVDREKVILFQQHRRLQLPNSHKGKIGKNPKNKTTPDCCQVYNMT